MASKLANELMDAANDTGMRFVNAKLTGWLANKAFAHYRY